MIDANNKSQSSLTTTVIAAVLTATAAAGAAVVVWYYSSNNTSNSSKNKNNNEAAASSPKQTNIVINQLIQESLYGNIDNVKQLLEKKEEGSSTKELSINSTDDGGNNALHAAVCGGKNIDLIYYLISKHKKQQEAENNNDNNNENNDNWKEQKNSIGCTVVWLAAAYGHTDILKYLISEEGCTNVNTTNNNGDTALLASCQKGHVDCVKILLEYGANVNQCNIKDNTSPLLISVSNNHIDIVKILLKEEENKNKNQNIINVDLCNKQNITPLLAACASSVLTHGNESNREEMVNILLMAGSDVTIQDSTNGFNALMVASFGCNVGAVRAILNHSYSNNNNNSTRNIDIDCVDSKGNGTTALWLAASSGSIQCCKLLIEIGNANPNHINTKGISVIDAAKNGRCKDKDTMMKVLSLRT